MVTKKLLGLATSSFFLVASLQSASQSAVKLLDAAIQESNKTKVQQLLVNIDFTDDQLLNAYTKALAVYDENNTFCGQMAETLLSPSRTASLVLAGISFRDMLLFMEKSSKLKKQADDGKIAYKKQEKALIDDQTKQSKIIADKSYSRFNAQHASEREQAQHRFADLKVIIDRKSMTNTEWIMSKAYECSSNAKRAFALTLAATGVAYYLSHQRSNLKSARTILAMLEVKCVQKGVQLPAKTN